jgi:hypothetical protein
VHGRGADFALPVKDNQPGLFDALDTVLTRALWDKAPFSVHVLRQMRKTDGQGPGRWAGFVPFQLPGKYKKAACRPTGPDCAGRQAAVTDTRDDWMSCLS